MRTFKAIVFLLSVVFIVALVGYAIGNMNASASAAPLSKAEMALKESADWNANLRWQILWWGLTGSVVLAALGGAMYVMAIAKNKREHIYADPVTGLWPVVRENKAPVWKAMVGIKDVVENDPNLAIAPTRKIYANGVLKVEADTHGVDIHTQAQHAGKSWQVQSNIAKKVDGRASRGMTRAEAELAGGVIDAKRRMVELRESEIKQRIEQRTQPQAQQNNLLPVIVEKPITIQEAISRSTERSWVIGQAYTTQPTEEANQKAGQLLTMDYRTTQAAIIGGSGSGKTESTAMLLVYNARKFGLHPIVLDGKEGLDWKSLNGTIEWHSMTKETANNQLDQIMAIFEERWELLQTTGAQTIYKIKENRPETLLILVEEFGDVQMNVKMRSKEEWKSLVFKIDRLFRLGRATGIVLCLIDQAPEKWSQQMRGNAKFSVCYKLKGGVANAFNEYHVDKLPPVGVFSQDNVFYKAWHTAEELDIIGSFQPLAHRYLRTVETVVETARNAPAQVVETLETVEMKGGDKSEKIAIPPSLERAFRRFGRWDEFCQEFFKIYPDTTQAQLRRAMSQLDGREPETFKTEAFRYYHRYSPNGQPEKANI